MPTLLQVRERRANAWAQAQEFNSRHERGEEMSAEDSASWDRALADIDAATEEITRCERTAALDAFDRTLDTTTSMDTRGSNTPDPQAEYRAAWLDYMQRGANDITPEQRSLLAANFRAAAEGTGSAGGYTVPTTFWAKLTETMKWFGGAADGAEIITTDSGNPIQWPTNDDTANVGYQLGENTQATNEGDLVFGQKALGAYTYVSGPMLVPFGLIQDSAIDFESVVARKMGERLGRVENTKQTTGTGGTMPQGYMYGITTGVTTASATAITYDELIDLIHSIDPAYRMSGRCRFKMNDLVLAKVRKLRDDSGGAGLGRPLWEPSMTAGVPDTILGYPYTINNDMESAITASKKTVAFGDFTSGYVIRRVTGATLMRLTERYADYLQVGFIGYERMDAVTQDSSAFKALVQHA